ncbi:MAG: NAD(P)-dependent oxidoreductase, partial [Chloroflexota bacterium]
MTAERFLVTGALGCIGAWSVKQLLGENVAVWTYDLPGHPHRLQLILDDAAVAKINFIHGDITDANAFEKAVADNGITHIVHLAALQVPFVRADPIQGARVNVVGTTIVLETVKRHMDQVRGVALASSVGVYGPPDMYPLAPLAHDAPHYPTNLYGVFKHANEDTARIYWQDYGVRSVTLRPCVVYGVGRDQGMTSTPTKAMVAAAVGRAYHISYGGTTVFQYAADAARVFIRAARSTLDGAPVFNLGGSTAHMREIVTAIEEAAPEVAGRITFEP